MEACEVGSRLIWYLQAHISFCYPLTIVRSRFWDIGNFFLFFFILKRPLVSFEPLKLFFRWCVAAGCAGGTAGRSPSPACASGAAVRFWGGVVRWVVGCGGGMRWNAAISGVWLLTRFGFERALWLHCPPCIAVPALNGAMRRRTALDSKAKDAMYASV